MSDPLASGPLPSPSSIFENSPRADAVHNQMEVIIDGVKKMVDPHGSVLSYSTTNKTFQLQGRSVTVGPLEKMNAAIPIIGSYLTLNEENLNPDDLKKLKNAIGFCEQIINQETSGTKWLFNRLGKGDYLKQLDVSKQYLDDLKVFVSSLRSGEEARAAKSSKGKEPAKDEAGPAPKSPTAEGAPKAPEVAKGAADTGPVPPKAPPPPGGAPPPPPPGGAPPPPPPPAIKKTPDELFNDYTAKRLKFTTVGSKTLFEEPALPERRGAAGSKLKLEDFAPEDLRKYLEGSFIEVKDLLIYARETLLYKGKEVGDFVDKHTKTGGYREMLGLKAFNKELKNIGPKLDQLVNDEKELVKQYSSLVKNYQNEMKELYEMETALLTNQDYALQTAKGTLNGVKNSEVSLMSYTDVHLAEILNSMVEEYEKEFRQYLEEKEPGLSPAEKEEKVAKAKNGAREELAKQVELKPLMRLETAFPAKREHCEKLLKEIEEKKNQIREKRADQAKLVAHLAGRDPDEFEAIPATASEEFRFDVKDLDDANQSARAEVLTHFNKVVKNQIKDKIALEGLITKHLKGIKTVEEEVEEGPPPPKAPKVAQVLTAVVNQKATEGDPSLKIWFNPPGMAGMALTKTEVISTPDQLQNIISKVFDDSKTPKPPG